MDSKNILTSETDVEIVEGEIIEANGGVKSYSKPVQDKTSLAHNIGKIMGTIASFIGLISEIKPIFFSNNSGIEDARKIGEKKRNRFRSGKHKDKK